MGWRERLLPHNITMHNSVQKSMPIHVKCISLWALCESAVYGDGPHRSSKRTLNNTHVCVLQTVVLGSVSLKVTRAADPTV